MARLPPSRHAVHRGLRIPGLREGDDSPLRTSFRRAVPSSFLPRRLPPPRILPCGLNGTFQTRLPPCAEGSSPLSSDACRAVHAAAAQPRGKGDKTYDAVVLTRISHTKKSASGHRISESCCARTTFC